MRLLNYKFENMNDTIFSLLEEEIVDKFSQTVLDARIHMYDEFNFFFIGDENDHDEMIKIFKNTSDLKEIFGEFKLEITDMTNDVLFNIDKFDNLKNYCTTDNIIQKFYESNVNVDFILDKISKLGIDSLSERDRSILESV